MDPAIMRWEFAGELWYWRGPAPFHFITVPEDVCVELRAVSRLVSYGWGVIPVSVWIGGSAWDTSLFPKDGGYVLPVKDVVRIGEELVLGDAVSVAMMTRS